MVPPVRRPALATLAGLAALLAACAPRRAPQGAPPPAGAPALRLLHLNDVYEIGPVEGGRAGGLARVATLRRALADSTPFLVTTLGGDYLSPSALGTARVDGTRLAGRQMVATLNALGLDVAVVGNHEFDVPEPTFRAHLAQARFPVLGANVRDSAGQPFPGLRSSLVLTRTVGGRPVRVGFVGVVLPSNQPAWVRIADPLAAAADEARRLRDSVDVLVALTHLAVADDVRLADAVPAFDLVLGGHEHERITRRAGPRDVPILKADANARSLQVVRVDVPAGGPPVVTAAVREVTDAVADDATVAAVVRAYEDSAFAGFATLGLEPRRVVARVPEPLDGRESAVRTGATALTRLLGEAMAHEVPGAAGWLYNGGSIRIDDVVPAGVVTEYDVIRILPFGGRVVQARLRGALLRRVLDQGVRNAGSGGWLQTSATRLPDGAWRLGDAPIADSAWYRVAVNDFLLTGQETGLDFLTRTSPDVQVEAEGRDVRLALVAEMRRRWP